MMEELFYYSYFINEFKIHKYKDIQISSLRNIIKKCDGILIASILALHRILDDCVVSGPWSIRVKYYTLDL